MKVWDPERTTMVLSFLSRKHRPILRVSNRDPVTQHCAIGSSYMVCGLWLPIPCRGNPDSGYIYIYIYYNIPIKLAMPLCVYNLTFERDTHERKIMAYLRINPKSSNNHRCFGGSLTLIVALSTILIGIWTFLQMRISCKCNGTSQIWALNLEGRTPVITC